MLSREILQARDSNGKIGVCVYLFICFGFFWTTKFAETKEMNRYTQCIWNICVKRRKTYCNLTIFSSSVRKSFKALDIRESFDKLPYSSWRCGGKGPNSDQAFHNHVFSSYSVALGYLKERDRGGLLLEQVRVCVCPAQGQNESPLLTVEAKLKLLLFRARRRSCMVSTWRLKRNAKKRTTYFTTEQTFNTSKQRKNPEVNESLIFYHSRT